MSMTRREIEGRPATVAEFLAWEEQQELRYEFNGFESVVMTGGSAAYAIIQRDPAISIGGRLQRYVLLSQQEISATMFERTGGDWIGHLLTRDAVLRMPEIKIEVPLAELYDGLDLPAQPA